MPRNPFTVLELPLDATADVIKAAWRRLARQHHPDVTSGDPLVEKRANHTMAEINTAYHELRDPDKRRLHREVAARAARAAGAAGGRRRGRRAPRVRRAATPHPAVWARRLTEQPDRTRVVGGPVSRGVFGGRMFGRSRLALTRARFCGRATPLCSSSIGAHFRVCRPGRVWPKNMNLGERPRPPGRLSGVAAQIRRPTFRRWPRR